MMGVSFMACLGIAAGALVWYGGMWLIVKLFYREKEVDGPLKNISG